MNILHRIGRKDVKSRSKLKMPAVAKKIVKVKKEKDVTKKPKKQSIKKLQKTAEINAAKKLTKLKAKKAVSHKVSTNMLDLIFHFFFK